jgi:hypothetical protein
MTVMWYRGGRRPRGRRTEGVVCVERRLPVDVRHCHDESADVIGVGGWFDSGVDLAEAVLMQ